MTETGASKGIENKFFIGPNVNDVVAIEHTTMATEEPSVLSTHKDYRMLIGTSGAGSVSALSLNDATATTAANTATVSTNIVSATTTSTTMENVAVTTDDGKSFELNSENAIKSNNNNPFGPSAVNSSKVNDLNPNNNNNNNNSLGKNGAKGKRRRRKSKQMNNSRPYKKSNWKFQVPRSRVSTLVPYNTNKFLMEEHMPEYEAAGGRFRDSSFSIDSDENIDEEEFLSKEFSSVYESARAERLDEMDKAHLIQEYLQMESNYEKLCNSLKARYRSASKDVSMEIENQNHIKKLETHVKELTAENTELRRQMADIRSREHHSPPNGRHRHYSTTSHSSKRHGHHKHLNGNNGTVSSEDSESDSSSSSSSNSSNSSHNSKSSKCRSKLKRSRSRSSSSSSSNSSKSTLSDAHHMSGVSDAEEAMHLLNGCDSNGASSASVF